MELLSSFPLCENGITKNSTLLVKFLQKTDDVLIYCIRTFQHAITYSTYTLDEGTVHAKHLLWRTEGRKRRTLNIEILNNV
jgi:hypothetical protein